MKGTIIVAIDGSEHALKALDYAIQTAEAFSDTIVLINAQPKIDQYMQKQFKSEEDVQQYYQETGTKILADAVAKLSETSIDFEAKVRVGVPSIEISNEAKERQARCIILGSRGLGQALGNVLGSVSYSLIHLATCPVTIVPAKEIKL